MLIQWLLIVAVLCFDVVIVCDAISTVFLEQKALSNVVSEYTLVDNISFLPLADAFVVLLNVVGLCLVFWCYRRTAQNNIQSRAYCNCLADVYRDLAQSNQ